MSWLLVVQPDPVQAGVLRDALRGQVAEDILVAESLDVALAEIDQRIPDVILLPTLLPAAVEDYLIAYLGAIPSVSHVQILGLPRLERSTSQVSRRTWSWFPWRRRVEAQAVGTPVCDPAVFARDVIDYLANARALKKELDLYSGAATLDEGANRRSEPRYASAEVPWISLVRFGGEQVALINVSSRGALLRMHSRPDYRFLKRTDQHVRERSRLTVELAPDGEVHAMGRVIRCVPLTSTGAEYEIAFSFDHSVGLHLPASDALAVVP
jgi:hypothetical protein